MSFFIQLSAVEIALIVVFVCACIPCGYKTQKLWFEDQCGVKIVARVIVGLIWPLALFTLGVISMYQLEAEVSDTKKPEKETGGKTETFSKH